MSVKAILPKLDLDTLFPFELDSFQKQAIAALEAERSVVVCAPTGSGKTLIGEYAIYRALNRGRRVFYTTPLKALSNQKLRDFREMFGAENVGLLTGDASINRDAPILVMTTEIFRNMLYGTPIGEVGTSLVGVEAVVLDECHYMNDRQRGTVWEESIIYCPPDVQLVALSATVANSEQLTEWIHRVHGPTELIYSDFRPVPLQFGFSNVKGLFPLLDNNQKKINPQLAKSRRGRKGGNQRVPQEECPGITTVVGQLQERDMLPAIYFIFSRRGCDRAVEALSGMALVTPDEARQLREQVDAFLARNPEVGRVSQIEPLYRGIASHHAGLLPAWKAFVEELFQQGLVKVVFATETLAAGINMPARTTVISSLSKRTDRGHRLLNPSEFLQMAGRAGRRGMDTMGYVVTAQTPFEGAREASYLATAQADPLVSQFTPSYGMVLNLLQTHSMDEARELVERSFGQYLSTLYLQPQQRAIADLEAEYEQLQAQMEEVDWDALAHYEKLSQRLKEERRLLKILQQQAEEVRTKGMVEALKFAVAGTILSIKSKPAAMAAPLPAVLVTKVQGSGQFPYLVCLGEDNRWYVVATADVVALYGEIPRLAIVDDLVLPPELPLKPGQARRSSEDTAIICELLRERLAVGLDDPALMSLAPEVSSQLERATELEQELEAHPVHQWRNRASILKRQRRLSSLRSEINQRQEELDRQSHRHWEEFLSLIDILQAFGCLHGYKPTEIGEAIAAIRGDNELWLGMAMLSGSFDALQPHHFAAACAALVTEVSRPDIWTRYTSSPEVDEALNDLRGLRRQLFQLQRRHQVAMPIWLEEDFISLVEQWALEADWVELCNNTSLDEGDVVRVLRRTLDFLSQLPHVPHLPEAMRRNAYQAIRLIDRFPVSEAID